MAWNRRELLGEEMEHAPVDAACRLGRSRLRSREVEWRSREVEGPAMGAASGQAATREVSPRRIALSEDSSQNFQDTDDDDYVDVESATSIILAKRIVEE